MHKVAKKIVLDGEEVNIPGGGGSSFSIPSGVIWPWYHTVDESVPDGWELCNGENGTPDLRGRFLLGASSAHTIGSTGGSEEVTLTVEQMPSHTHNVRMATNQNSGGSVPAAGAGSYVSHLSETTQTGNTKPHANMPPYFTIDYIMKL